MKKRIAFSLLFAFSAIPCHAQWKYINGSPGTSEGGFLAFGAHDTTLFASLSNEVLRYTVARGWFRADTGLLPGITFFASVGPDIFASIVGQRAYRTTNDGSSWSAAEVAGPVGTNGMYLFGQYLFPSILVRSRDNGLTWDSITNLGVNNFAANGACIFASTNGGINRSTDSGGHWSAISSPPFDLSLSAYAVINSWMFAGGSSVFRSTDSGQSWTPTTTPPLGVSNGRAGPGIHALASYQTYLFAGTDSGVFMSHDSGMTWQGMNQGLIGFDHANVLLLTVFEDTELIAEVDDGYADPPPDLGYTAARSIPEMIKQSSQVVQAPPAGDSIEIYPNPSLGTFSISSPEPILGIQVTSILGSVILTRSRLNQSNLSLDLSNGLSGRYFLEIQTRSGTVLRKVIRE